MKREFVFKHWFFTLLFAPLTSQVIHSICGKWPHQIVGLLEIYPITLLFSLAFSLPTYLVYLSVFYFLTKQGINLKLLKVVLIIVSVLGIFITQLIIQGSMSEDIIISYSITTVIVGLLLKLRNSSPDPGSQKRTLEYD
jgi:hypothetical protein